MRLINYIRLWLASARYSVVRTMMMRFDFLMWSLVEFFWISVNILTIKVTYSHTDSIAGWNEHQMMLLIGTSLLIQRIVMGFFWSNVFEIGRNVRSGHFDFFLAQPGNVLFTATTRKIDLDSLANAFVSLALVLYAVNALNLSPSLADIALYCALIACGVVIQYSLLVILVTPTFWIVKTEGIEGSYFTLNEFSRLPREAYRGFTRILFTYALPVVVVTNTPANQLLNRNQATGTLLPDILILATFALAWFALAIWLFHRGLRRYSSASS
jgi:ABC-2 type transport system permease protein